MGDSQNTKTSPIQHVWVGFGKFSGGGVSPKSELPASHENDNNYNSDGRFFKFLQLAYNKNDYE